MDYLTYVEMNAENLQFYLWYKDYVHRWETKVSKNDKALSPEWDHAEKEAPDLKRETEIETGNDADPSNARTGRARRKESQTKLRTGQSPSVDVTAGMPFFGGRSDSKASKPVGLSIPEGSSVMSFGRTDSPSATGHAWKSCEYLLKGNDVIVH